MAPSGLDVRAQITATAPVKPPLGVIVIVEFTLFPGEPIVTAVLLNVKTAGTTIVNGTDVVSDTPPALPVTVTV
jgi:hypothetical protein